MLPDFALPNSVSAEGIQRGLVRAAEGDTDDPAAVGYGENDLRRTIVGADLHTATRGDELAAFNGVADTFRAGIVVPISDVQVEELLFIGERAVGLDLVAIDPLRVALGDREQPLVGPVSHAGGEFDAAVRSEERRVGKECRSR